MVGELRTNRGKQPFPATQSLVILAAVGGNFLPLKIQCIMLRVLVSTEVKRKRGAGRGFSAVLLYIVHHSNRRTLTLLRTDTGQPACGNSALCPCLGFDGRPVVQLNTDWKESGRQPRPCQMCASAQEPRLCLRGWRWHSEAQNSRVPGLLFCRCACHS